MQADTWSSTYLSCGWVCAESSRLWHFSSLGGKKGDFSWEYPRAIPIPLASMARADPADPGNPLWHWESLGGSLACGTAAMGGVLCRAGGPSQGDLIPGGASLLPIFPRTLPSWSWHGSGKPPSGVRVQMYFFTLVHDRINRCAMQ